MSHLVRHSSRARCAIVCSLALFVFLAAGLVGVDGAAPAWSLRAGKAFAAPGGGNGVYDVQVMVDGTWMTVGSPEFGLLYGTRIVHLNGEFDSVRLVQRGGTAAQLECVLLDGVAPVAVAGSSDALAVDKVRAVDNDVTNAFGDTLVLEFAGTGSVLQIDARVQGDIAQAVPFEYPRANTYGPVTAVSSFYPSDLNALPSAIDTSATPFVREFAEPGTGHPKGYTYAWVATADGCLLVTIDFTSDNTMDGDEDYATVHVKTPAGVKDFKLSAGQLTWGDVAFTYTDKVSYQHKVYSFRIPLSSIGVDAGPVGLAFTTYGTSAISLMPVYRFYNMRNGSHFYTMNAAEKVAVDTNLKSTYFFEGIAYQVDVLSPANDAPLFRFFNKRNGSHFYTANVAEKALVESFGTAWAYEGVAHNVALVQPADPTTVYRFLNTATGGHFYTANEAERTSVLANLAAVYKPEGIAFFLAP